EGGQLRDVARGRPAAARGAAAAAGAVRLDGVQHLPDADGGRRRQADAAPGAVPGLGIWLVAGRRPGAGGTDWRAGAVMNIHVKLFARARDLAGTGAVVVELPDGATVGDLRRRLAGLHPVLANLLERSALAVNDEFADDTLPLPPRAEVALLP